MEKKISDAHIRILEKESIGCRDVVKLLGDYTDKELTVTLKARIDAHVSCCEQCREIRDSYKMTVDLASELSDQPVPVDVQNRLRRALNEKLGLNLPQVTGA